MWNRKSLRARPRITQCTLKGESLIHWRGVAVSTPDLCADVSYQLTIAMSIEGEGQSFVAVTSSLGGMAVSPSTAKPRTSLLRSFAADAAVKLNKAMEVNRCAICIG